MARERSKTVAAQQVSDIEALSAAAPSTTAPVRAARFRPTRMTVGSLLLLVALLATWEFGVRLFHVPKFLLPPFSDVVVAMWDGLATSPFAKDGLWLHTGVTLWEIVLGFALGSAIGLVLAIVISEFETVDTLTRSLDPGRASRASTIRRIARQAFSPALATPTIASCISFVAP